MMRSELCVFALRYCGNCAVNKVHLIGVYLSDCAFDYQRCFLGCGVKSVNVLRRGGTERAREDRPRISWASQVNIDTNCVRSSVEDAPKERPPSDPQTYKRSPDCISLVGRNSINACNHFPVGEVGFMWFNRREKRDGL